MTRVMAKAVCRIAAKRLLHNALQLRKSCAGSLLKTTRAVRSFELKSSSDFSESCHTVATEPYFYDTAYRHVSRTTPIPIDKKGICHMYVVEEVIDTKSKKGKPDSESKPRKQWKCYSECQTCQC